MCRRLGRFTMTETGLPAGLWLIGLGPGNLEYMSKYANDIANACSKRFLEGYTAILPPEQEEMLEDLVGDWERIMRPDVENPDNLLKLAKDVPVALLIVGDPMQATTHVDLESRCDELGINFNIVPGITATALAVSLSGLQSYRFGRQVTIPFSYGDYLPCSPLEMICNNYENNLHTLVLLDLDPTGMGLDKPTPMMPNEAVSLLQKMADKILQKPSQLKRLDDPVNEWSGILLTDISMEEQKVSAGSLSQLSKFKGGWIHCMIIPASMNQNELEAFQRRMVV
jgi:diphthine synthase